MWGILAQIYFSLSLYFQRFFFYVKFFFVQKKEIFYCGRNHIVTKRYYKLEGLFNCQRFCYHKGFFFGYASIFKMLFSGYCWMGDENGGGHLEFLTVFQGPNASQSLTMVTNGPNAWLTGSEQGLSSTRRSSSTCMMRKGLASTGVSCLAHHGHNNVSLRTFYSLMMLQLPLRTTVSHQRYLLLTYTFFGSVQEFGL